MKDEIMNPQIYIDGHISTTGLRIRDWLSIRRDIDIVSLPEELRKNTEARREMVLSSDIAILCLPDNAAIRSTLCTTVCSQTYSRND